MPGSGTAVSGVVSAANDDAPVRSGKVGTLPKVSGTPSRFESPGGSRTGKGNRDSPGAMPSVNPGGNVIEPGDAGWNASKSEPGVRTSGRVSIAREFEASPFVCESWRAFRAASLPFSRPPGH